MSWYSATTEAMLGEPMQQPPQHFRPLPHQRVCCQQAVLTRNEVNVEEACALTWPGKHPHPCHVIACLAGCQGLGAIQMVWGPFNSSGQLTLPERAVHSALQVYKLVLPNQLTSQL